MQPACLATDSSHNVATALEEKIPEDVCYSLVESLYSSLAAVPRVVGVAPGSEWILHGCDFGCDSDVNFRCEDLHSDSAWM